MTAADEAGGVVADRISELLPGVEVVQDTRSSDFVVLMPMALLDESLQTLRDDEILGFQVLIDLFAIDRTPAEPRFQLVYHLVAPESGRRLFAVVDVADLDAEAGAGRLPTVSGVWPAADWLEREVHDLFGLVFDGHPDLRRILLAEELEGHPLRRDFVLAGAAIAEEPS